MLEDVGAQHRANDDTAEAIEIINGDSRSEEAVVGSHTSHHHIANQKIGLRHCHIMFLRWLTLDEVKHGWRALHTKETAHQPAQCSSAYLNSLRGWQLDFLTEQHEVDANQNEYYAKDATQYVVFYTCQSKDGDGRDEDERQQNWPKSLPSDATPQPPYDSRRGGDGQ